MSQEDTPTIPRHRILRILGEGGMGIVYEAEQLEPVRRRVALKVMKIGLDTKAFIGRFQAERQALAMLEHPTSHAFTTQVSPRKAGRSTRWSTCPASRSPSSAIRSGSTPTRASS